MTYEEARKFLKNVITYPLKPDGEDKYPNYWRAKFIDVLNLLDEQAEVLRILGKFGYYACEAYEDGERPAPNWNAQDLGHFLEEEPDEGYLAALKDALDYGIIDIDALEFDYEFQRYLETGKRPTDGDDED